MMINITLKEGDPANGRKIVQAGLEQLKHIRDVQGSTDYLERDIAGYNEILNYSDDACSTFIQVKMEARERGEKFADNLKVIDHMIETGLIKERLS